MLVDQLRDIFHADQLRDLFDSRGAAVATWWPARSQERPAPEANRTSGASTGATPEVELPKPAGESSRASLEDLIQELFDALDGDGDGVLDQSALVRMNRRLALLHLAHDGQDSPPPAPMLDPASLYDGFREHMLHVLDAYNHSTEAKKELAVHLISLERHSEAAHPALLLPHSGPEKPARRHTAADICSQPVAVAQEYCPAVLESSKQAMENARVIGSRAVDASKATSRSVTQGARRLAIHATPHLQSLADSARSASTGAATRATLAIGDWLATARDGLQLEGCLAASPDCRRPLCGACSRAEMAGSATPGADASPHEFPVQRAEIVMDSPVVPVPPPEATRQAPVLRGPGEVVEKRSTRPVHMAKGDDGREQEPRQTTPEQRRQAGVRRGSTEAERRPTTWRYEPEDGLHIDVRSEPDVGAPRTGGTLSAGDVFRVSEEREGADGVLYLRLADRDGWVFDRKPGVGRLCIRAGSALAAAVAAAPTQTAPPRRRAPAPLQAAAMEEAPASAPQAAELPAGLEHQPCSWLFQPQAGNHQILQMAEQLAARNAKDHDPSAVQWPRSSLGHLPSSVRRCGA